MNYLLLILLLPIVALTSCQSDVEKRFNELPTEQTGIDFVNRSLDKKNFNIFNYRNFYNGGGVAIGDVNGDGLPDVFLTSNFEQNKLYLNEGKMHFKDITVLAGITQKKFWSTGVTMADVNGDGRLDIYVCNSGSRDGRGNQLYINQGNKAGVPVFVEQAKEYGLEDGGFSTHAAFFDYDRDGDLDMYLLNNSFTPMDRLQFANLRDRRDKLGGDKLFRNDGKRFTDVSAEAGIYGSLIGFGLGITIGDVNNDNWPDIYISNDFYERDYLYINQKNGTFKESIESYMPHTSLASMGADIADVNNDGNLDIFVTDMLPDDDYRLKTTTSFDTYDLTRLKEQRDFWHQDSRNMFHLNNGDGTFSEVGRLANVHATDWSWGALLFDMDMDGHKDIFVANGILKDLTDQDYVAFLSDNPDIQDLVEGRKQFDYKEYVNKMGSTPLANYAFRNKGDGLQFDNEAAKWGLGKPSFSNGSAYGDLDNDGDLDLVVNNNNSPVSVYQNLSVDKFKANYLRVQLVGGAGNIHAIGAKVFVHQHDAKNQPLTQYLQQMPNRGFQSSVDLTMVFGLGANPVIDSVRVVWADQATGQDLTQSLRGPKPNQTLTLNQQNARPIAQPTATPPTNRPAKLFADATTSSGLSFTHIENDFVDYNRDGTLKQMLSREGPALAVGDVNGDGLDDVYFGGAAGQVRALYIQQKNGTYRFDKQPFLLDANYTEDVAATFFDADGDHDLDLYVATGGNEFTDPTFLADRLFRNDGHGHFTWDKAALPRINLNNSCVTTADVDLDGDLDIFVGTRIVSGEYGKNPEQTLLINDGKGNFQNVAKTMILAEAEIGMVTSAVWADVDNDRYPDLVLAGDWMPITVLHNKAGKGTAFRGTAFRGFEKLDSPVLAQTGGWWNTIRAADLDGDGDLDFVAGNLGLNSRMVASTERPAHLYANDFDKNGTFDPMMSCFRTGIDGESHECLMMQKPDLQRQIPSVKQKFLKHTDYANATLSDLFTDKQREDMIVRTVQTAQSVVLLNDGNGAFTIKPLPIVVQESPVRALVIQDFTGDGRPDVLLAGNFFDVLTEIGRYDANYGLLLVNIGKGNFRPAAPAESGFFVRGQVRNMAVARGPGGREQIVLAKNNDPAQVFSVHSLTKGIGRGK